ncbi:hypothetical protein [Aquisalinus flavus]|uniref:Uncharacterized protein n=1 Tax=Aquisalinus flavus TaxID=1526572 RepID=A0A8J2Y601_9PROT|nr:hypothetical protein [Aquisalinus flavus]MBD0426887.1 hypothetical protein [Aquisalinus flavus]GGC96740.1 hypothetical protein GCM10011342_02010 [Aquisalinus flavus]
MLNFSVSTSPATWRQALFFFGIVIFMIGVLMVIPTFAELAYGERGQYSFAMSALLTLVIGLMVGIAMWNGEFGAIRTRHAVPWRLRRLDIGWHQGLSIDSSSC